MSSSGGTASTRNPGFGYLQYHGEMGFGQVEQGLSSYIFCRIFGIFDDFSKWSAPKDEGAAGL